MFGRLTPLVKNLLIINIGIAAVQYFMNLDLGKTFGLYFILWKDFMPHQFVTYMFLHSTSGIGHIFGNMFALFIFGPLLENFLGPKKFLFLYMATGIGAGLFYTGVNYIEVVKIKRDVEAYVANPNPEDFNRVIIDHGSVIYNEKVFEMVDEYAENPNDEIHINRSIMVVKNIYEKYGKYPMVGASGAIFGILAAFALFFSQYGTFSIVFFHFP